MGLVEFYICDRYYVIVNIKFYYFNIIKFPLAARTVLITKEALAMLLQGFFSACCCWCFCLNKCESRGSAFAQNTTNNQNCQLLNFLWLLVARVVLGLSYKQHRWREYQQRRKFDLKVVFNITL